MPGLKPIFYLWSLDVAQLFRMNGLSLWAGRLHHLVFSWQLRLWRGNTSLSFSRSTFRRDVSSGTTCRDKTSMIMTSSPFQNRTCIAVLIMRPYLSARFFLHSTAANTTEDGSDAEASSMFLIFERAAAGPSTILLDPYRCASGSGGGSVVRNKK
jgi:hypothetical protein